MQTALTYIIVYWWFVILANADYMGHYYTPRTYNRAIMKTPRSLINVLVTYLRNNSAVFEELEVSMLWIWRSQMQFYTDNSSNTVLLFLFLWNSPNVYTLVWKHTNKWRYICTFQICSTKKIVRQIRNWHRQLFKYSTAIPILMNFSQRLHTSLKTYK